jgi:hypothetical protein
LNKKIPDIEKRKKSKNLDIRGQHLSGSLDLGEFESLESLDISGNPELKIINNVKTGKNKIKIK